MFLIGTKQIDIPKNIDSPYPQLQSTEDVIYTDNKILLNIAMT